MLSGCRCVEAPGPSGAASDRRKAGSARVELPGQREAVSGGAEEPADAAGHDLEPDYLPEELRGEQQGGPDAGRIKAQDLLRGKYRPQFGLGDGC